MENKANSHSKAVKKYNAKTYKNLQVSVKIADYNEIDEYCKSKNISKASMIINSVKYCIKNGIDFDEEE